MDPSLYLKWQQDIKTEQLLMEREVRQAYNAQLSGGEVIYYETYKNSLLDGIIK